MSTLHEVASAPEGKSFMSIGPVVVHKQFNPKIAKNGKLYSTVIVKATGHEIFLSLWDEAAKCRLPEGELTLRGKFSRTNYGSSPSLRCEDLTPPEGAGLFGDDDIKQQADAKPLLKDCIDAGLRAADYITRKDHPELAEAAFSFAAHAFIKGVRME